MEIAKSSHLTTALRYATLALAAMPVLGMRPMVLVIVVWLALAFASRMRSVGHGKINWQPLLILSIPFLLMLVDQLRANDLVEGWRSAERSAALVIFPIGFLLFGAPSDERIVRGMTTGFTLAATVLALYVNVLMYPYLIEAFEIDAGFSATYRSALTDISGVHPPYAAYWFLAGALFQLDILIGALRTWVPTRSILWRIGTVVVLLASALFIGSRMPLFAFVAAIIVLMILRLPRPKALRLSLIAAALMGLTVLFVPGIRERIMELTPFGNEPLEHGALDSVSIRAPIGHCSLEVLESNWLVGIGATKLQPALDQCYGSLGHQDMIANGYGPHDQLLNWWLAFGILGLAAFVLLFGWSMRIAWQRNDALHLAFLLFMFLCCFTEDLLSRQWGVVLFACFNTMFVAGRISIGSLDQEHVR